VFEQLSVCFTISMVYACYHQLSTQQITEESSIFGKIKNDVFNRLVFGSLVWSVAPAIPIFILHGFGGAGLAWCWIYFAGKACLTEVLRLGLQYGFVVIVFVALLYMYFTIKSRIGILGEWEDTVMSIFKIYLWVFVSVWSFPTLNRFLQLWPCIPCPLHVFLQIAHTTTITLKGTLNFTGFLYHFFLRPKLSMLYEGTGVQMDD